jgi:pectin methylesterase-like acyl-CoA thioesterase
MLVLAMLLPMAVASLGGRRMAESDEKIKPLNVVVNTSGRATGQFASIQDAIDSIPDSNTMPTTITLQAGTYE